MVLRDQQLDRMTSAFVFVAALLVLASLGNAAVKSDAECAELGFISSICARANCAKLAEAVGNPGDGKATRGLWLWPAFLHCLKCVPASSIYFVGFIHRNHI